MADLELDSFEPAVPSSEIINRPDLEYAINGQAGFFGLAMLLGIPIINNRRNIEAMRGPALSGRGVSFAVSRFDSEFQALLDRDFVNLLHDWWFAPQNTGRFRSARLRYVVKRIATKPSDRFSDAQHLACIVNEMRVLSNRTLRQSRNIVALLGISWFERPVRGRFWPQLLIESAE